MTSGPIIHISSRFSDRIRRPPPATHRWMRGDGPAPVNGALLKTLLLVAEEEEEEEEEEDDEEDE